MVASPNTTICFGQSTNIFANASGGTGPYTYSWTPSSISGSGPVMVNPTVTTNYNVYAVDANGCLSPVKNIQIYVHPPIIGYGHVYQLFAMEIMVLFRLVLQVPVMVARINIHGVMDPVQQLLML
ncbi:MAG: hypothetical protein KatS3mg028_0038 [Bacteroidia bacterium]|nr:MAG: hypothetical protein KatS3mg028_0038 [Bacteroidia bacterium]